MCWKVIPLSPLHLLQSRKTIGEWFNKMPYCRFCKDTKSPLMKGGSSHGKKVYICRRCNTRILKKYRSSERGKAVARANTYKSIKKYPQKQAARVSVRRCVKEGKLTKPISCSSCGRKGSVDAHHEDYTKPLDVVWLCKSCHSEADKGIKSLTLAALC